MDTNNIKTVSQLIIECLEAEGVKYIFGLPGEENLHLVLACANSSIKFILVRHEQGASFMADIYGRLTGKAGVCISTLGPGAINLLLGVADAQTDSTPLVAISAQVGLNRIYKESHQYVDLVSMFKPITKWADIILTPNSVPEMIRKAFELAQTERPGAVFIALPEDVEEMHIDTSLKPLLTRPQHTSYPDPKMLEQAKELIVNAKNPVILVGHGAVRNKASEALQRFAEQLQIPVATTFMAKGILSDRNPLLLGVIGFMKHDYENFAFDKADLIISIGYELQEFTPSKINPNNNKNIIHIHQIAEDEDIAYPITVAIQADISATLNMLCEQLPKNSHTPWKGIANIIQLHKEELEYGESADDYPLKPQRVISDIRKAMKDDDIVLVDTGAVKMWMARLYPTYLPLTCIISNGLSTMAFSLPGALAAKLACPDCKVLVVTGDGGFMMNSQEIETAIREKIPFVILIWEDKSYGLIKWKMDMEIGKHQFVDFTNPDFVTYAEAFGAKGYSITKAEDLLPILQKALNDSTVSVISCPVDYSENMKLIEKLGELDLKL
ncbi:acetolactate synthase large subunit [Lawsonia intracellularis]|uniref:acetolactate synthase large subunit n=1 Tax=Lawsonia intracellularis TaxID=29546 RepID=UPI0002ADBC15|nr:acetolactate synthase large subunit [Lawsonia intracellularis]AGC49506.1 acetolactate synthase [Lawsonia intracellularis N343]KAA0205027.1 acetolactate synthase large subunit [Lawsonia intracellularis]MBZ3892447.1 acetolactate synthase large subunit [Lawsonia intracellularis]RBN32424.1 acetolactate synthase large subunit [Lawsonia intracellularis]